MEGDLVTPEKQGILCTISLFWLGYYILLKDYNHGYIDVKQYIFINNQVNIHTTSASILYQGK